MKDTPTQTTVTDEPLTLHIDIAGQVDGLPGPASVAAHVYLPPAEVLQRQASHTLLTLVHGGTYTRRYWDFLVPGYERDTYSCARYLARQGHIVVTLDTLGMGESHCTLNGFELTTTMMAQAVVLTTRAVENMVSEGTLARGIRGQVGFSVLVGHSMGGHLSALAQAKFKAFNALILEGIGGGATQTQGLDESTMQRIFAPDANGYVDPPRQALHPSFHGSFGPPAEVVAEDDRYAVPTPGSLVAEIVQRQDLFIEWAGQIDVPVLLTYGESDFTVNPFGELAFYTASPSRSLYILPGSAHCTNYVPARQQLWQVLAQFVQWAQAIR